MESMHPGLPVADWSIEDLVKQYTPLMSRWASYEIPGLDRDDIMQELMIRLHNAQRGFSPEKGVDFFHYFNRACRNTVFKLAAHAKRRGLDVARSLDRLAAETDDEEDHHNPLALMDLTQLSPETHALLSGLSDVAKRLVRCRLEGLPLHRHMTRQEVNVAKVELSEVFERRFAKDRTPVTA